MKPRIRFRSILLLATLLLPACSRSPQTLIIGKWGIESVKMAFQFQKDGEVAFSFIGITQHGTYRWIGNDELETKLNGKIATYKVSVNDKSLELTTGQNQTLVFSRVPDQSGSATAR